MKALGIVVTLLALILAGWVGYNAMIADEARTILGFLVYAGPLAGLTGGVLALGVFLWAAGVIDERLRAIHGTLDQLRRLQSKQNKPANDDRSDGFLF